VVEGNITSVARFESYAVQPPKEIEDDDGYDPRYDDSESNNNNSFDSTGYELSGSYNDSSIEGGVEKRLSASLEAGKYGTGFQQQHMTSFGNNQEGQSGIKTASHHM
jgi:hypothetical protein